MKDKVRATVLHRALFTDQDAVVAAVSGGADSMALLHLLCSVWSVSVTVVHVNHQIRGAEAERDADFVRAACVQYGVPFVLHTVNIPRLAAEQKCSVEACARTERYRILQEEADRRGAVIATAHTLTDQTETVLLNLTRGSGSRGLCGMPYKRGKIVRPLLDCTREEVECYCAEHQIDYVTDSTNADLQYARNRIRGKVLPELRQLNPQIENAIARMTEQLRVQEMYLRQKAEQLLSRAQIENGWSALVLKEAPVVLQTKALLLLSERYGTGSDTAEHHIHAMQQLLQSEGTVNLPGAFRVVCKNGILQIYPPSESKTAEVLQPIAVDSLPATLIWNGQTFRIFILPPENAEKVQKVYKMSLSAVLNYDTISKPERILWRSRCAGDRFQPVGRCTKTLKKWFNEVQIPLERRAKTAVLEINGQIVWVEGLGISNTVRPVENCNRLIIEREDTNGEPNACGH